MKYIDINQKFTAKVAEYIAKGYTINTATMSGSQGEVAHVDLTDGKQVVRVLLDSFTEHDSFNSLSGLEIVVGTPADKVVPYDTVRYNTIWNNRLEVIESERFYEIGSSKRRGNTFYGTKAEAEQAEALSVERYKAKSKTSPYIDLTDRYLPLAVSIVKKRTGCTRVQKANVRIHKDSKGYALRADIHGFAPLIQGVVPVHNDGRQDLRMLHRAAANITFIEYHLFHLPYQCKAHFLLCIRIFFSIHRGKKHRQRSSPHLGRVFWLAINDQQFCGLTVYCHKQDPVEVALEVPVQLADHLAVILCCAFLRSNSFIFHQFHSLSNYEYLRRLEF